MRILIVEDDGEIAEGVRQLLIDAGYFTDVAHDGETALQLASLNEYGAIVLDVLVPLYDGWQILNHLQKMKVTTPVLMLTALNSVDDKVRGLEHGADDYLIKPFEPRELVARVGALLRRDKAVKTGKMEVADLIVDTTTRTATRDGSPLKLTPREYLLLEALVRNTGRVLTREVILGSIFNADENTENSVSFHIASLRKKIDDGRPEPLIRTVHGFGYSLETPA